MSILVIGSEGSMGKRYQAILRRLSRPFSCIDKEHTDEQLMEEARRASGIIISSPTDTHLGFIKRFLHLKRPILCEKPITKDLKELKSLFRDIRDSGTPFRMMMQYSIIAQRDTIGPSFYDYFRHGTDGLVWDCIQIIGLARAGITLKEESPFWACKINGKKLSIADMDGAYIAYIQRWLYEPEQDLSYLYDIHQKTHEMSEKYGQHH